MSVRYPMWVWQSTLLLVAPSSPRVLVYGMMMPSHAEYQVAYLVEPGVSSPDEDLRDERGARVHLLAGRVDQTGAGVRGAVVGARDRGRGG